nr:M15 family metallopeptidase [Mycolicibacterium agri]
MALIFVGAFLTQCGAPSPPAPTTTSTTTVPTTTTSTRTTSTRTTPPTTASTAKPTTRPTPTTPTPAAATVRPVTAAELGASWRPGCPVGPELLRRVSLDHVGFDGQTHRGELIVHQDLVADVIAVFEQLYRLRYPIEKMRTVEHYPDALDELSMEDNNTSAFNCRPLPSGRGWSLHAYGRAIDINPLINPYIDSRGNIEPKNAGPFLDRARTDPGMLHAGDPAVLAFTDRGWRWGGDWRTPKDYQHFERR